MPICYECRNTDQGHDLPQWHYRTVEEPCDRCGATFSHERWMDLTKEEDR